MSSVFPLPFKVNNQAIWQNHTLKFYTMYLRVPFFCQDANKTRSNCTIIGCSLSKKHKLTLYKTQNGERNYVDHTFFFNLYQELPM